MKLEFLTTKESAVKMVLATYEGEPCRVCGKTITDATKAIYAGYSMGNQARSAHKSCWDKNLSKSDWVYSQDSDD